MPMEVVFGLSSSTPLEFPFKHQILLLKIFPVANPTSSEYLVSLHDRCVSGFFLELHIILTLGTCEGGQKMVGDRILRSKKPGPGCSKAG